MTNCLACNSTNLFLLGYLGNIIWLRCRNCGIDIRVKNTNMEIEGED